MREGPWSESPENQIESRESSMMNVYFWLRLVITQASLTWLTAQWVLFRMAFLLTLSVKLSGFDCSEPTFFDHRIHCPIFFLEG